MLSGISIFDTENIENIYPNDDFWNELSFLNLKRRELWIASYAKHLHWDLSGAGTRWGNIRIYIEYRKYSKVLYITQHSSSFYYDEVDFEPIILHNPTQQEIKMAQSQEYLSSRLTYKFN